jgi:hypothetical protein
VKPVFFAIVVGASLAIGVGVALTVLAETVLRLR